MDIKKVTLATCSTATDTVVVIDVVRAFTTAAYALAAGAADIVLTGTVEEALAQRQTMPGSLVMGEVDGLPVPGFDFDNSPAQFDNLSLAGRRLIQRTSAGTQGVVLSTGAATLLAASFPTAGATARYILQNRPAGVTFVITGVQPGREGDEDDACADYIAALLRGQAPDPAPFIRRVYQSATGRIFADPAHPEFAPGDLDYCTTVDRFDFAMPVDRQNGQLVMRAVKGRLYGL